MTFRRHLARCLTHNLLLVLALACLVSVVHSNAPTVRKQGRRDSDVVECWDGMRVTTQQGACK